MNHYCQDCLAFGPFCNGSSERADGCRQLDEWVQALNGLTLDMPLAPQPQFDLPSFIPQLLNGLEVPSMLAREPAIAVGIAKALTPRGRVSRRAIREQALITPSCGTGSLAPNDAVKVLEMTRDVSQTLRAQG